VDGNRVESLSHLEAGVVEDRLPVGGHSAGLGHLAEVLPRRLAAAQRLERGGQSLDGRLQMLLFAVRRPAQRKVKPKRSQFRRQSTNFGALPIS